MMESGSGCLFVKRLAMDAQTNVAARQSLDEGGPGARQREDVAHQDLPGIRASGRCDTGRRVADQRVGHRSESVGSRNSHRFGTDSTDSGIIMTDGVGSVPKYGAVESVPTDSA